jgi:hypothetical protein
LQIPDPDANQRNAALIRDGIATGSGSIRILAMAAQSHLGIASDKAFLSLTKTKKARYRWRVS